MKNQVNAMIYHTPVPNNITILLFVNDVILTSVGTGTLAEIRIVINWWKWC